MIRLLLNIKTEVLYNKNMYDVFYKCSCFIVFSLLYND